MNEYKQAWYANTLVATTEAPKPERIRKVVRRSLTRKARADTDGIGRLARETGLTLANEVAHRASKTAMTGTVGTAVRMGGRVGVRVIPVIGYALLAYDIYQIGRWIVEES